MKCPVTGFDCVTCDRQSACALAERQERQRKAREDLARDDLSNPTRLDVETQQSLTHALVATLKDGGDDET